jgi:hypothetical protein
MGNSSKRIFAGNQPTYLPWVGIFDQMMHSDVFVCCDDFQASFPGWLNRNRIKGPKGELWLTIPVARPHEAQIKQIKLAHDRPWRHKHLRSIEMCYSKAPYFERYIGRLREIFNAEWVYLHEFTIALIKYFRECLGISKEFVLSSGVGASGHKSALVVDLCRRTKCNAAYLGAGTRSYVDARLFKEAGIEIEFQDLIHPVYPQQYGEFASHLGVVDILMNCGPGSAEIIRRAGEESRRRTSANSPAAPG